MDVLIIAPLLHAPVSGAGLIRELRALPGSEGRTPVLAITSPTDPARRIEVLRSGADDFIPQPVVAEELTVRVERLVRGKRRLEESEAQRASFEALALTDPLTTLNNRRFLGEVAPMYLAEARRHGFPLSVILVDIDRFDHITHTYTPAVCEEVLRSIGRLLRSECRRGDVAVRCKDDEFVLLMSHCSLADAQIKAESLRARVAELRPCGVVITVSVGVAQARGMPGEVFADVFGRAARAARRGAGRVEAIGWSRRKLGRISRAARLTSPRRAAAAKVTARTVGRRRFSQRHIARSLRGRTAAQARARGHGQLARRPAAAPPRTTSATTACIRR